MQVLAMALELLLLLVQSAGAPLLALLSCHTLWR